MPPYGAGVLPALRVAVLEKPVTVSMEPGLIVDWPDPPELVAIECIEEVEAAICVQQVKYDHKPCDQVIPEMMPRCRLHSAVVFLCKVFH